jgi:hypothetical protein
MTAPAVVRPRAARSRFLAILTYTLQSCFPRKRWAALLLPCLGAVLFGLIAHTINDTAERAFANVAAEGLFGLVMPIAALIIGDSVLGAEVRAGTFHFTWLSPAPTWQIVVGRWLGGSLVALVTIAPACALAAVVAGTPESGGRHSFAAAVGSVSYVAIFIADRLPDPPGRRVVARARLLRGTPARRCAHRHRQRSPTWESRAIFVSYINDARTA